MDLLIRIVEFLVTLILIPCVGKVINIAVDSFLGDSKLSIKKVLAIILFFTVFIAMITIFIFSEELLYICLMLPILILSAIYIFNFRKINNFIKKSIMSLYSIIINLFVYMKKHKIVSCITIILIVIVCLLKFLFNMTLVSIYKGEITQNNNETKNNKEIYTLVVKNIVPYIPRNLNEIPEEFYKDNNIIHSITIPNHIEIIRKGAFKNCKNLKTVVIGENVTLIEDEAFANCIKLENVEFRNTKKNFIIGNDIFIDCKKLESIKLPNSLIEAGTGIFNGCKELKDVVLPNNKQFDSLEAFFFTECEKLEYVKILNGKENDLPNIVNIGFAAFYKCKKLKNLNISNVKTIHTAAFMESGLEKIELNKVKTICSKTFLKCSNLKSITISNVKNIDDYAFYDCNNLKEINYNKSKNINYENNIESIGSFAFYNCGFEDFYISNNLKEIADCAFLKCNNLKKFNINKNDYFVLDEYNALLSKDKTELVFLPNKIDKYNISSKIKNIRNGSIAYLNENVKITIDPQNQIYHIDDLGIVKDKTLVCILPTENYSLFLLDNDKESIGPFAAVGSNLMHIDLQYTDIVDISEYAFYECKKLKAVSLPNNLCNLGSHAFYGCENLSTINIPYNIKKINSNTFHKCSNLRNINFISPNITSIDEQAFSETKISSIELPNSVSEIGSGAFNKCKELKYVKLPKKLKTINEDLFHDCNKLKLIEVPNTINMSDVKKYFEEKNIKCKIKKYRIETEEKLNL